MGNNENCTSCNMKLDINNHITHSSKENNFTLESLNNKINNVLELLEVIKSRLPKT